MNSNSFRVLLIFVAATAILVAAVSFNVRGYQDSWILEDVTLVTLVYIFAFSVFASVCDDNRLLAVACALFIIVLNAIPNLKYEFFQGTFDSVAHYGYVRNLVSLGHVPNTGFYAPAYQDFPGMHIFIGSISIISGLSVNATIKLVTSIIVGIIPIMTYFATNRVFDPGIQRFIVVASGLPIFMSYTLSGSTFGMLFYFSIICLILRSLVTENTRQRTIVLLILAFGLLFSHAVTTLFIILFLVIAVLLLKFLGVKEKWVLKSFQNVLVPVMGILIIVIVSFAARLTFGSGNILDTFANTVEKVLMGHESGVVPETFFKVPFSAEIIFLTLNHIKDAVIALMSCVGVAVLFRKLRHESREIYEKFYMFLLCIVSAILALLSIELLSGVSYIGYERFIFYAIVLSPFLVGLFLWHLNKTLSRYKFGFFLVSLVLFSCISVSLIQIFPYQPISPRANVLSQDLPTNEYVFDSRSVNTIYQERMILFAESFSSNSTKVASDTVTRWQIYGFANDAFINRHIYYSPLENQNLDWDLFLLHYDGKAGPLNEKVENRTSERLTELKDTLGNVVYDNGESFIISRNH